MENSSQLFERAQRVSPGGVHSPVRAFKGVGGQPLFFSKASGAHIETVEGVKLIDFCQSFGPNLLGHRDPDLLAVVHDMVDTAWSLGTCEPYSLDLAEWITSRLPWVENLRFVCSGTEAVMSALRLARAATGRDKILKFNGCYHGHVDSMLVKAGSGLAGEACSDSAGVSDKVAGDTLVAPLDDEESLVKVFAEHGDDIAAVILEPLPANYGLLLQRREFIQKIFDLAHSRGALVIFDEVISGFRVGLGGMAGDLGFKPDLVTYGKIIGGGFPVGCFGGRESLMKQMAPSGPVYQAGTLAANPIGMSAGLATLKKVEALSVYKVLEERTSLFVKHLKEGLGATTWDVSYKASLFWIHPRTEQPLRSPAQFPPTMVEAFRTLFLGCLKRGVYLAPSAYEVGFVSYAHDEALLDIAAKAIVASATEG